MTIGPFKSRPLQTPFVPDFRGFSNVLLGIGQQARQDNREGEVASSMEAVLQGADVEANLSKVMSMDPIAGRFMADIIQRGDAAAAAEAQREIEARTKQAAFLLSIDDPRARREEMMRLARENPAMAQDYASLVGMDDEDQILELRRDMMMGLPMSEVLKTLNPEQTSAMQNALFAADGDVDKARELMAESLTTPETTVNISEKGASAEAEALAKQRASGFTRIMEAGEAAESQLEQIEIARSIDVETNPGEGLKLVGREIGSMLGMSVDEEKITNAQTFRAVTGKMVLDQMAAQKGPQTDKDQERIAKTLPSLDTTEKASAFLLDASEAVNRRKVEQALFWESYPTTSEDGTLKGVRKAWNEFKRSTPMISERVTDPRTGLPIFFYQYARALKQANPGMSDEQILAEWRSDTSDG